MKRQTTLINGLDVVENGQGMDPVIFLHGGPGVFGYIQGLSRIVDAGYKTICYNQRGSKQTADLVRISDHVDDLRAIVQHYSSDGSPILVGHSWGAMLALIFGSQYSELVQKIVLIGCGSLNAQQGEAFQRELSKRFGNKKQYFDTLWQELENGENKLSIEEDADRYINEILDYYQNDRESAMVLRPLYWDFQSSLPVMLESDELTFSNTYERILSQITTKVVLIHGTEDLISSQSMFELVKKHLPLSTTHTVKNGGHFPWVGRGKESFERVFLQELSS